MAEDEILTVHEVAALLKVGGKTTYTMAQAGQLPGFKVGGQWRFRRTDIDAWIQGRVAETLERPAGSGGKSRKSPKSGRGGRRK